MCGIVGYTGSGRARDIVLDGLKALEYRGYDSAGIALVGKTLQVRKCGGRVEALAAITPPSDCTTAIGHTRWATHGAPTARNAHPHLSFDGKIAVVHNGVVENHELLREELIARGIPIVSETDSELIAHLLALESGTMTERISKVARRTEGALTFLAVREGDDRIYCHRRGAALIVAHSDIGSFASSDMLALAPYAERVTVLQDGESAVLSPDGILLCAADGKTPSAGKSCAVTATAPRNCDCHMREEIAEIPDSLYSTYSRFLSFARERKDVLTRMRLARRILLTGCGTAYHACLYGKEIFEEYLGIPCTVLPASEAENPRFTDSDTFSVFVTQSGETADTLKALAACKELGAFTLAITNVAGSSATFAADAHFLLNAGAEIAVAATKSYCCQLLALWLLAKAAADERVSAECIDDLCKKAAGLVKSTDFPKCRTADKLFFIGKGTDYITATEGALKFKEITYKCAEAHTAGELKHGTIALADENSAAVVCMTVPQDAKRIKATVSELKSRGTAVYAVSSVGDAGGDATLAIPVPDECALLPVLAVIPMQMLALECAIALGLDPDKPRNLAKSVTVI